MTTSHTPGPLVVTECDDCIILAPPDTDATVIARVGTTVRSGTIARARTSKANALRLAHCYNTHDDMLSALRDCEQAIARLALESASGVPMWASDAHDKAIAAIAKATGTDAAPPRWPTDSRAFSSAVASPPSAIPI